MKIAILGTRGIPNHYGGYEQFAEYLSLGLVKKGHTVAVYNSHTHPYQEKNWQGVEIIHCNDPEDKLGTAGQFLYDLNCIRDSRKRNFDIILQLGYTSSSVWGWMLPKKSVVTTNMDGLEWKRSKYSRPVQKFLLLAERLGMKYSDYHIADSVAIQEYLKKKFGKDSVYIPYGAHVFNNSDPSILKEYNLSPNAYDMLIARLEPENNIEMVLDGAVLSGLNRTFIIVGKHQTKYGEFLKEKYKQHSFIRFVGGIYDITKLNNIRYYSNLYFHGHSVGGTNPSLLEAMASHALICAHNNDFNRYIIGNEGYYFGNPQEVAEILKSENKNREVNQQYLNTNLQKIATIYDWNRIIDQYEDHFNSILGKPTR